MLFYSHDVVAADAQDRRSRLLAEAAAYRQARQAQPSSTGHSELATRRPRRQDRMLAAAGALLVQWGERLQAGERSRQIA